ncbi:MAG TPA: septal ring lytic transglycosylase RlpA family protein [Chitinophagaceae bacterium]|nr:septal ring lytic transglycosylase RlpA family protein [Chitinophagaceae bacterium]
MGLGLILWSWIACTSPTEGNLTAHTNNEIHTETKEIVTNTKTGIASFYHDKFVGRPTATGDIFTNEGYTAASNFFKLGTYVKVTNTVNGKFIYVKINDRMGHPTRVIDLTERAAKDLDFINRGVVKVKIEEVEKQNGRSKILAQKENLEKQQSAENNNSF